MDEKLALVDSALNDGWRVFVRGKRTIAIDTEGQAHYLGLRGEASRWERMTEVVPSPVA